MQTLERALKTVSVVALCTALLTACGSDSKSSNASGTSGSGSNDGPSCSAAPESMVNSILGTNFTAPEETKNEAVTVCNYTSADGTQAGVVRFEPDTDNTLEVAKKGFVDNSQPVTEVSGIGDEAFSSTLPATSLTPESNSLIVRKGTNVVQVAGPVSIDKEKQLAEQLLKKF